MKNKFEKFRKILEEERAQILNQDVKGNGLPIHMNPDRNDLAQDFITLEKSITIEAMGIESVGLASIRELNRLVNNIEAATRGCFQKK